MQPRYLSNATLLGGVPRVVPAGTAVRIPALGSSLDFAGFNVCSLLATLAGLSGGDSFKVHIDVANPTIANAPVLTSNVGRQTVITATTNGSKGGTCDLEAVLGGYPALTFLPIAGLWQGGGWGCNVADMSVAMQTNDGATSLIQGSTSVPLQSGATICIAHNNLVVPQPSNEGWKIYVVATKFGTGTPLNVDIYLALSGTFVAGAFNPGGPLARAFVGTAGLAPGAYDLGPFTNAWTVREWPLDAAVVAAIRAQIGTQYLLLQFQNLQGGNSPGNTPNFTQAYLYVPGAAGVSETPTTFFRNVLTLDATACTHDVTVSSLEAVLTGDRG
jgi:hypothetical protein